MWNRGRKWLQILRNMGLRYVLYRLWYTFKLKVGILEYQHPTSITSKTYLSFETWQTTPSHFFLKSDSATSPELLEEAALKILQEKVVKIEGNQYQFFSSFWQKVVDWHTNPQTGFHYDEQVHWTKIKDLSPENGDIKYVWEKSRFSFLFELIRYQECTGIDQSSLVFSRIENWIDHNPVNQGPNWRCSQEISIRVLAWLFALEYYRKMVDLDNILFQKILNSIYHQMTHVATHLSFSRNVVRNNHIITEALALYIVGTVFPFFDKSVRWKLKGKAIFEDEIIFQIDSEGTYLQHSMNYHRVVVQLLAWFIRIGQVNRECIRKEVVQRASASLQFLKSCQDPVTGWLPNYGNNDGALFFPLSSSHFRDFRPQLYALSQVLGQPYETPLICREEAFWLGVDKILTLRKSGLPPVINNFKNDGYFVLKEEASISFLRNTHYKNRPFQADNLHLDIWVEGLNIIRDAGTYQYNTDEKWIKYFAGTEGHNTVQLDNYDQMLKGPRFIWFDWIRESKGKWYYDEPEKSFVFDGYFIGYKQLGQGVKHRRRVTKKESELHWVVEDWLEGAPDGLELKQLWHTCPDFLAQYSIVSYDEFQNKINLDRKDGWYSELYGKMEEADQFIFSTFGRYFRTIISKI